MFGRNLVLLALLSAFVPPPSRAAVDPQSSVEDIKLGTVYLQRADGPAERHVIGDRIVLPQGVEFRLTFVPDRTIRDVIQSVTWDGAAVREQSRDAYAATFALEGSSGVRIVRLQVVANGSRVYIRTIRAVTVDEARTLDLTGDFNVDDDDINRLWESGADLSDLVHYLDAIELRFGALPSRPDAVLRTVPVTVTITRVLGIGDDLDGFGRDGPDFYAGVRFAGGPMLAGNSFATHQDDQNDVSPFWTITSNVVVADDDPAPATSIELSIWDHDECSHPFCTDTGIFESDDDQLDIKPGDGETVLLTLNLNTGRWTGDVNWPQSCVQGDGGEAVKVCFDISVDSPSGDADGDFLLDGWERNGFDADGDGTIDVDLPGMGANVNRKDLFLEIDCLTAATHTHCPLQGAIQDVVQSFANASVNNVDGTAGVQLHVDVGNLYGQALNARTNVVGTGGVTGNFGNFGGGGNQIAEAGNLIVDWDGAAGNPGTNFYTLKAANFNANRALVFRYGLFVHQTNARRAANDCTSGWAEGIPGNDFLVSLGGTNNAAVPGPCWATDAGGNSVGSRSQQAGTLQHEFGHVLGLQHGGGDGVNNKPNYLSVMNYSFQACGVPAVPGQLPGGCDYSRIDLPDLNEVLPPGLDECVGIDGGLGLGAVNWDGDALVEGLTNCQPPNNTNVSANINGDFTDTNGNGSQDPGEPSILGLITGFEDWNSIRYDFRTQGNFSNGVSSPVPDEPDPETIERSRTFLTQLLSPTLSLDKTGPTDATPGDVLNYAIEVKNSGRGPALKAMLSDTKPDATQQTFDLGIVTVGAQVTRNVSFTVPCATADRTILTNSAGVAAEDMLGNPVSGSDTVHTTIHTPVMTLSKTATASVNAGEAITYRITYANTGSGAAASVVITDTVPVDVYYSTALDLGAGPKPTTVVTNANGTTTLTWTIGTVAAGAGPTTIEYTARPSLLFLGGETLTNSATLAFQNANGCVFTSLTVSASTVITVVDPTRNPLGMGFWRNRESEWTAEILARIQATDQRFDGADGTAPNGVLSSAEVTALLAPGGNMGKILEAQLLATYLNLATRRINASTGIGSKLTHTLGLNNIRDAVLYARGTLALAVIADNRPRYDDATAILDQINNNRIEDY